jgi:hypothetical protein
MDNYKEDIKEVYSDICTVTREDTNQVVEGEVLQFRPQEYLKVVIGKSVALNMQYEKASNVYICEKSRMPFFTKGPDRLK